LLTLVPDWHVQAGVAADLGGFQLSGQHAQLGQQCDSAGLSDTLGLLEVRQVLLVLRLLADQLAGSLGQPLDALIQTFDAFDFIVDKQG